MKAVKLRSGGSIETISFEQMKNIIGGNGEMSVDDGLIPACNTCRSGETCAKQSTSTGEYCMCGAKENWKYC